MSDRKIAVDNNGDNIVDFFSPDVVSANDYYAYGGIMPGRSFNANSYDYGMNSQIKDNEIFEGAYSAEYWEYDARTGRRWNTDIIVKNEESPYACFGGNPIVYADPNGADKQDKVLTDINTGEVTNVKDENGPEMIEHAKGTWNKDHTSFTNSEPSTYEHVTFANAATQSVRDIDLGKAANDRAVWKQYGKNFKDLADFSEKAIVVIGVGAAVAPVAIYIAPIVAEGSTAVIAVVNEGSLLAQAEINVMLSSSQRILIEGTLKAAMNNLPKTIVNSAAFWKLFQSMLVTASKGRSIDAKTIEIIIAAAAKKFEHGFNYQRTPRR